MERKDEIAKGEVDGIVGNCCKGSFAESRCQQWATRWTDAQKNGKDNPPTLVAATNVVCKTTIAGSRTAVQRERDQLLLYQQLTCVAPSSRVPLAEGCLQGASLVSKVFHDDGRSTLYCVPRTRWWATVSLDKRREGK
jgi:hypothetical protein